MMQVMMQVVSVCLTGGLLLAIYGQTRHLIDVLGFPAYYVPWEAWSTLCYIAAALVMLRILWRHTPPLS